MTMLFNPRGPLKLQSGKGDYTGPATVAMPTLRRRPLPAASVSTSSRRSAGVSGCWGNR